MLIYVKPATSVGKSGSNAVFATAAPVAPLYRHPRIYVWQSAALPVGG